MVIQRKVKGIGGNGLKKNVRNECEDGEDDLLPLAGQEEVLALSFLQSQFLAKAAKQSNQILFQVIIIIFRVTTMFIVHFVYMNNEQ